MPSNLRYLGLDVHAETIAAAVGEPDGEVRPSASSLIAVTPSARIAITTERATSPRS
jgi:hypothetical protein